MNLQQHGTAIMIYFIVGILACILGMIRERQGKTMGNADSWLVYSLFLGWPIYALGILVNLSLKALKSK